MHTHRLKLPTHEAFLREERHDPVTGDAFCEGDEVVFCASCRSAFLKSSWEYMGGAHCGQRNTLAKIPYAQAIDVKKGVPFKDDEIVFSTQPVRRLSKAILRTFQWRRASRPTRHFSFAQVAILKWLENLEESPPPVPFSLLKVAVVACLHQQLCKRGVSIKTRKGIVCVT